MMILGKCEIRSSPWADQNVYAHIYIYVYNTFMSWMLRRMCNTSFYLKGFAPCRRSLDLDYPMHR